ncbi:MAG: hypothetical protein ACE5O2_06540 [Armatimonadota bacterium]
MHPRFAVLVGPPLLCLAGTSAAELPLSRVVLFSSGVGYFERTGEVEGAASVELSFRTDQINDILKSLVLLDLGGGTIGPVTYAPRDPLERTLRSFGVDIAQNPSLSEFARSLRGTRVEIASQTGAVQGVIFGTEVQEKSVGENVVEFEVINVLTDDGIVQVPVWQIKSLRLSDAELNGDLNKALKAMVESRNTNKRPVRLSFHGKGKRPVLVGYLLETPVWKTGYRLVVEDEGDLFLQGWAIVENTTDDDWDDVRLALVAGQPISFTQDLYEPLYVERPTVLPQVRAITARPRVHEGVMEMAAEEAEITATGPARLPPERKRRAIAEKAAARGMPREAHPPAAYEPDSAAIGAEMMAGGRYEAGVLAKAGAAAMAAGEKVGELFQYAIEKPVSIARQQSAMIPIVSRKIEGEKVSVYNEGVNSKFPLNGIRLRNTSGLHLMRGSVTVLEGNAYAGDALIGDLAPGDERLITYAVDLAVEVEPRREAGKQELVSLKIARGTLITTRKQRSEVTYNIKNVSDDARTVLIEHPLREAWDLVQPKEADERTREVYRFKVEVPAKDNARLQVAEERPQSETVMLSDVDADEIATFVKARRVSEPVKQALGEIVKRKAAIADLRRQRDEHQARLDEITKEQERIRKNMDRLDRDSELYQMYVRKLTDQEREFEQLQGQIKKLRAQEEARQKELDEYILNLDVG